MNQTTLPDKNKKKTERSGGGNETKDWSGRKMRRKNSRLIAALYLDKP